MDLSSAKVGFIGAGNMAQALGKGMISAGLLQANQIWANAPDDGTLDVWKAWGCNVLINDNTSVFETCDIVVLAVKPNLFPVIVRELKECKGPDNQLVLSVMSGITIADIEKGLYSKVSNLKAIIRVMPNTPALVSAGCAVYSLNEHASCKHADVTMKIFESVGICHQVPESQLNAFTGLSGSGPAYVYMAIEALSDGAVKMGIPRPLATQFAAQMVYGSAKMVLDTKRHPGSLRDDVCSPGGTTIAGVHALEKAGFRCALMDAVEAATLRAQEQSAHK
ncbi:hypothetical protein DAPPUDRAFT_304427 [Daphnia pulex]|uniref:Pyrroline-5-carboxylate reductase n=1 Tax=Daphnia pulex TaxID=6669 RepID=E9GLH5_DAPPU|nr:hypothetical protein DAPPUDRAFT_304427 [Daphnia pulex]|eukprot:EFX79696.1 hypothetical protein DAPPUDRAFT_304427 [Daphnia pulex]